MFHFLKHTVMLPDFMAREAYEDDITISAWDDYVYMYPKQITINHVHCKQKFESFEQWFETNFDSDAQFIEWMYQTRELRIRFFADMRSFAKLMIKWTSFVCPKLTCHQVYHIYQLTMKWFYVSQIHFCMMSTNPLLVERHYVIDNLKSLSYRDFELIYNSGIRIPETEQINQLKPKIQNYISNELKYAFYLNGDESFKPLVQEHVDKALVRCFKMEMEQYKTVNLFDAVYDNIETDIKDIHTELFDIIKQTSKTLSNDLVVEDCIEQLYQYGVTHNRQMLNHNNQLVDAYHDILANDKTLADKIEFISNITGDGITKSEFVDCFMSSYDLYNLLTVRWILTLYRTKDNNLKNFIYM